MKTLNLDIKSKNVNIGQIEKCDTVKLVATLEEKDYSNSIIRILGKKADKTFVEQIVEATGNKVEVTLKKQFTTCEGITRIEINVVTGEEEWTSNENYFYVSSTINNDVVSSSNDVETLEEVKKYVTSAASDLKEFVVIKNDLATANETMKNDELKRKGNELLRTDKEAVRIKNEFTRTTSEEERESNEILRVENENTRKVNENNRKINEISRTENENSRILAEKQRQESFEAKEEIRNENENTRIKTESERKKHFESAKTFEEGRKTGENVRISNENTRLENEETRKTNEVARQKAEENREATYSNFNEAELDRKASETSRKTNEVARINAESERNNRYENAENDRNNAFAENEEVRSSAFTSSELSRKNTFLENEEVRGIAFAQAESIREENEITRKQNETLRSTSEIKRNDTEKTRLANETARVNAETIRKSSEVNRVNAENLRVVAEENRETVVNEIKNSQAEIDATLFEMTKEIEDARGGEETLELNLKNIENRMVENVAKQYLEASTSDGSLKVENCYNGLTKDLSVTGRTLQNLSDLEQLQKLTDTITQQTNLFKVGLGYNFIFTIKDYVGDNDKGGYIFTLNYKDGTSKRIYDVHNWVNEKGKTVIKNIIIDKEVSSLTTWNRSGVGAVTIENPLILEGEQQLTSYFKGIKSLGEEEDKISILSTGKNLIDLENSLKQCNTVYEKVNDSEFKIETNSLLFSKGIFSPKKDKQYTISFEAKLLTATNFRINIRYIDGTNSQSKYITSNEFVKSNVTSERNKKIDFIRMDWSTKGNFIIKDFQIEEGTTATTYEEYKADKKDILIPVSGGAKELPNKVADEQYTNGDYLQNVDIITFNGADNENWTYVENGDFAVISHRNNKFPWGSHNENIVICNKYPSIFNPSGIEAINNSTISQTIDIYVLKSKIPSISEWKTTLSRWNTEGTPLTVYYKLAEPILHKAENPTDYNFTTFKEITHVSCLNKIAPSSMSAKFPVDLPATISRLTMENKGLLQENVELSNKAEKLIIENECQQIDIDTNMVATVELFEMMINVTANTKHSVEGNDGMVEVYVSLIIKGKKKLEDVPMIIRPQVEAMLKELGIIV